MHCDGEDDKRGDRTDEVSSHLDRPLIDETGLKGYYDFSFRSPGNEDDGAMQEIEEDLGVRFDPRKMDLTTYVIDSAEKPTDPASGSTSSTRP